MADKYPGLNELLQGDQNARQYFDSLPAYVREHIQTRSQNVNSLASLQDFAENLLRGDT